jgi:hypothetical protein
MDLTPIRVPGFAALWQLNLNAPSAAELVRSSRLAATLWKQSGRGASKSWSRRFAVLRPCTALLYFENEADVAPKGACFLDDTSVIEPIAGE